MLQGGDCAESFAEFSDQNVRDTVRILLQMAVTLTFGGRCPVVKVGRIGGQFAKPRSSPVEKHDGQELPSYRGDSVNSAEFTTSARIPDPERLKRAYHQAAATGNLLRALTTGGFASLRNVQAWNHASVTDSPLADQYGEITDRIHQCLDFMEACGLPLDAFSSLQGTALYTSHEALHLPYEESLLRETKRGWFGLSGHFLWIGERTRQPDHAHLEFMRGIENPIGVKLGPGATADDCLKLADILDPENTAGKLVMICRMGAENADAVLPPLLEGVAKEGRDIVWMCDPMHGNTETASTGHKTRNFGKIVDEIRSFFRAHEHAGTWPGGLHLEMTGRFVTECVGGAHELAEEHLGERYDTHCDPRLNANQALEIAFLVAKELEKFRS